MDKERLKETEGLRAMAEQLKKESGDGEKLVTTPEDNPICSLKVDKELSAIVAEWRQYATSMQMRWVHEYMLMLIREHGLTKILGDDTHFVTIHSEDQEWISQNWMPRAVEAGLIATASNRPSSYYGKQSIKGVMSRAPERLSQRVFDDLADAREWLRQLSA